jgi:hypothetical protein
MSTENASTSETQGVPNKAAAPTTAQKRPLEQISESPAQQEHGSDSTTSGESRSRPVFKMKRTGHSGLFPLSGLPTSLAGPLWERKHGTPSPSVSTVPSPGPATPRSYEAAPLPKTTAAPGTAVLGSHATGTSDVPIEVPREPPVTSSDANSAGQPQIPPAKGNLDQSVSSKPPGCDLISGP